MARQFRPGQLQTGSLYNISSSYAISASYSLIAQTLLGSVTSASYANTASYVNPLQQNVQLTGSLYLSTPGVASIYFTGSGIPGQLTWNDTDGTLELGLKGGVVKSELGQGLVTRIVNKTVPNIYLSGSNYQVVVVAGAQGQRLAVKLAQADNDANSAGTLGIVAENIDKNQEGFIITVGLLKNRDTTGALQGETWNDGDVLYLSPTTAGAITNVKPQAPQHTVIVGYVEYAHAVNGKLYIKIDNGYEIDELHNVRITTASLAPGQLLVRSGSNNSGVWINTYQLTGSYGLTGSLTATRITSSLFGTASYAITAATSSYFGETDPIFVAKSGSFATTGSNTFTGTQTITGSMYISGSEVTITPNILNVQTPDGSYTLLQIDNTGVHIDDTNGNASIDAENRQLYTANGSTIVIDWDSRQLLDTNGITVDWENNQLLSTGNRISIDWETRELVASNGLTHILNWDTTSSAFFTGSVFGTSSWASNAQTASFIITAQTASYVLQAISSSFATTASYYQEVDPLFTSVSGSYTTTASFTQFTSSIQQQVNSLTAATSSYILASQTSSMSVLSSSFAATASYVQTAQTASYVLHAVSSSFATTASYYQETDPVFTAVSGTFTTTASFNTFTASYNTASFSGSFTGNLTGTASWAQNASTASYVQTAQTASYVETAQTASYVLQAVSSSFATTASYAVSASHAVTSSHAVSALSSSYSLTSTSASHAQTASYVNPLHQNVIITGSLTATQITASGLYAGNTYISGSLTVIGNSTFIGSSSFLYVTASQLAISSSFISVNVFEPLERFGGLKVYDSGSSLATASLAWDSLHNHWVYQNVDGATYTGGMLLSGPRNTGSLGDEPNLTKWFIPRSDGGDHLDNSQIFSSESIHIVTGSLTVTQGITGSLSGTATNASTASYIETAQTASYVLQAVSASFASTASYILQAVSSSFASTASYVQTAQTASYILQAISASYAPDTTFPYTGSAIISGSLLVTGSFSVLDVGGFNNINSSVRSLYGGTGTLSVDWTNRLLSNASGVTVVDWRNTRLIDTSTTRSVDWQTRTLLEATQLTVLDWANGQQLWGTRLAIDWRNRKLYDTSPMLSADWTARTLHDTSTTQSADWQNRYLIDNTSIQSADWQARRLYDSAQSSSIVWGSRTMVDSGIPGGIGSPANSLDWENRQASDEFGGVSIYWSSNRTLADSSGIASVDWGLRNLADSAGSSYFNWDVQTNGWVLSSKVYLNNQIRTTDQELFISNYTDISGNGIATNVAGEIIEVSTVDVNANIGDLLSLGEDGTWYQTDQASISGSAMLGVNIGSNYVLIDGTVGAVTASAIFNVPYVDGTSFYGKPVYMRPSVLGGLTTTKPVSGYVRVVGHMYKNSTTDSNYWIMKFRPSNDWYEI